MHMVEIDENPAKLKVYGYLHRNLKYIFMGLFTAIHDTVVTADLIKVAKSINASHRSIITILDKYGYNNVFGHSNDNISYSDLKLVNSYLCSIIDKVNFMENRLNDIASCNRHKCMVPCLDGHMTTAPEYIMAARKYIYKMEYQYG